MRIPHQRLPFKFNDINIALYETRMLSKNSAKGKGVVVVSYTNNHVEIAMQLDMCFLFG